MSPSVSPCHRKGTVGRSGDMKADKVDAKEKRAKETDKWIWKHTCFL